MVVGNDHNTLKTVFWSTENYPTFYNIFFENFLKLKTVNYGVSIFFYFMKNDSHPLFDFLFRYFIVVSEHYTQTLNWIVKVSDPYIDSWNVWI